MKTFAIRTFVLALAVAGFSAPSMFSASATVQASNSRPNIVLSGGPAPLCPPNGSTGNYCNIR